MPDVQPQPATPAPAVQVAPSPSASEAVAVNAQGTPLTAGASLEEFLASPEPRGPEVPVQAPTPPPTSPPPPSIVQQEVPSESGISVATLTEDQRRQRRESAVPTPEATPPTTESPEPEEAPAEPTSEPTPIFNEDIAIERLREQHRGLLRTKGRQAQEIGDLRRQLSEVPQVVQQAVQEALRQAGHTTSVSVPAINREDLVTQILDRPDEAIPQTVLADPRVRDLIRAEAAQVIQQATTAWQEQQAAEATTIAPEVGKSLFLERHQITGDFDQWLSTDEGKAVNSLFERDPDRMATLEYHIERGDERGISRVLTKALEAHRVGKRAAAARTQTNGERQRVEASRPPSMPVRSVTPPPTAPQPKSILDPGWTDADLIDFMRGADPRQG